MKIERISIIGGGNMGRAIVNGLLASDFPADRILITRRNISKLEDLVALGVQVSTDNTKAAAFADHVVLAVKPWQALDILQDIKNGFTQNHKLISLVSAISIAEMKEALHDTAIYRAMPNTAMSVQESMTCIAGPDQDASVLDIFKVVGEVEWIDEELMDAATVLGACGTAYALRFIRAMTQGGIEIGFSSERATKIATQTLLGACKILKENNSHPEAEIDKVTTPKGCTIAGLNEMEQHGFSSALIKGLNTSFKSLKED